jgi:hypothetical protein
LGIQQPLEHHFLRKEKEEEKREFKQIKGEGNEKKEKKNIWQWEDDFSRSGTTTLTFTQGNQRPKGKNKKQLMDAGKRVEWKFAHQQKKNLIFSFQLILLPCKQELSPKFDRTKYCYHLVNPSIATIECFRQVYSYHRPDGARIRFCAIAPSGR